tara:strand:- start:161 stop:361 length:201 start_codon:yes stop_codon:yes gene_type:complete
VLRAFEALRITASWQKRSKITKNAGKAALAHLCLIQSDIPEAGMKIALHKRQAFAAVCRNCSKICA